MLTPTKSTPGLSLADVKAFDPRAARDGTERVSRCPICQSSERAFHFNAETGAYNCKRASCGARGKLTDFWQDRPFVPRRQRVRAALTRAFALPDETPTETANVAPDDTWREGLSKLQELRSTPGAAYMESRSIPADLAQENGVRFLTAWAPRRAETAPYPGAPAVLFPLTNQIGELVAANGRYIRDGYQPKTRIGGSSLGAVYSIYGALSCQIVTLCEGPFDALSLCECGFAAVAMVGCNLPDWLPRALAFKRVLIASDADEAGDRAAGEWTAALQSFGARCARFRPDQAKDFNEMHQRDGTRKMTAYLSTRLAHTRYFEWHNQ